MEDIRCKQCCNNTLKKSGAVWRGRNGNRKQYQQWICGNCGMISVKVKDSDCKNILMIPYENK